jgi:hypothetical protein
MNITNYIQSIQIHLIQTHANVLEWFEIDDTIKNFRPQNGGWTINEILEHIALTSHFLLILIDKGATKALRNTRDLSLEEELNTFHFDLSNLNNIGIHKSFEWIRPEHMEPIGKKSEAQIKSELIFQLRRCLVYLTQLKNGEGLLYKTTMTVDNLGKINVYEYIYFLSKHAERHLAQMEGNRLEYLEK